MTSMYGWNIDNGTVKVIPSLYAIFYHLISDQLHPAHSKLRIPLMATGDSEVKPTGIPLGSRPVFRCDGDRQMMRLRGVNVTVS